MDESDLVIPVTVRPGSGRFLLYRKDGVITLDIKNQPDGGKANQEIITELSNLLRCEVKIVKGKASRNKTLLLRGITIERLNSSLDSA